MVLSIAIGLKLTSGALVSTNLLLRIPLWLWLLFKWSLGVCSIKNSGKQWVISIMYLYRGTGYIARKNNEVCYFSVTGLEQSTLSLHFLDEKK